MAAVRPLDDVEWGGGGGGGPRPPSAAPGAGAVAVPTRYAGGQGGLRIDCSRWTLCFRTSKEGPPEPAAPAEPSGRHRAASRTLTVRRLRLQAGPPPSLEAHYALCNAARRVASSRWVCVVGTVACLAVLFTSASPAAYRIVQAAVALPPLIALFALTFFPAPFNRRFEAVAFAAVVFFSVSQRTLYVLLVGDAPHLLLAALIIFWTACSVLGLRFHTSAVLCLLLLLEHFAPSLALQAAGSPQSWSYASAASCVLSAALAVGSSYLRDRTERRLFFQELQVVRADAAFAAKLQVERVESPGALGLAGLASFSPAGGGASEGQPSLKSASGARTPREATEAAALAMAAAELEGAGEASPPEEDDEDEGASRRRSSAGRTEDGVVPLSSDGEEGPERPAERAAPPQRPARRSIRVPPLPGWKKRDGAVSPASAAGGSLRGGGARPLSFHLPDALISRSMRRAAVRIEGDPESSDAASEAEARPAAPAAAPAPPPGFAGLAFNLIGGGGGGRSPAPDAEAPSPAPAPGPAPAAAPARRGRLARAARRALRGRPLEPPALEARFRAFYADLAWKRVQAICVPLLPFYFASVLAAGLLAAAEPAGPSVGELVARGRLDWILELGVCGVLLTAGTAIFLIRPLRLVPYGSRLVALGFLVAQVTRLVSLRRTILEFEPTAAVPSAEWTPEFWNKISHVANFSFLASTFWVPLRVSLAKDFTSLCFAAYVLVSSAGGLRYAMHFVNFLLLPAVVAAVACARVEHNARRRFCIENGLLSQL